MRAGRFCRLAVFALGAMTASACAGGGLSGQSAHVSAVSAATRTEKKAILAVSFGTSYPETLKANIESVENRLREAFPGYEVRRAFTSRMIVAKLAQRDQVFIDNPTQALERLREEGYTQVVVQPLHIIPGEEFDQIKEVVDRYAQAKVFSAISLGRPILPLAEDAVHRSDYAAAVQALKGQLPEHSGEQAVLLMGHGTKHPANAAYTRLQDALTAAGLPVYLGTVETTPSLEDVQKILEAKKIKNVLLMPYMLVAGDHAQNDLAGDEPDSWKNRLAAAGYEVSVYMHGLGENPAYGDLYVQRVQDAIRDLNGQKLNRGRESHESLE